MSDENKETTSPQKKKGTSFRLSQTALDLLAALVTDTGQSQAGVVELALRDLAKSRGVKIEAEN